MNPPAHGWPSLATTTHLHARPAPVAPPAPAPHPPLHAPAAASAAVPTPAPLPPAARPEADVQWIVGWLRDLLVIAMAITNLLHASGGH